MVSVKRIPTVDANGRMLPWFKKSMEPVKSFLATKYFASQYDYKNVSLENAYRAIHDVHILIDYDSNEWELEFPNDEEILLFVLKWS